MIRLVCVCLLLAPLLASAAPRKEKDARAEAEAERLEVARAHFLRGEEYAQQGKLEDALVEYELAEAAHPSPSVAAATLRVHAQLEARYAAPPVAVAPIETRIVMAPPPRRPLRRFLAPILVAPFSFATLVAGGALLATVRHDTSHLRDTCSPSCNPSDVAPLRTREDASYALLGIGVGLAVVDAALWTVLFRVHERDPARVALEPSLFGLRGRF